MPLNNRKVDRIKEAVKGIILRRYDNFPDDDTLIRNAPFHTAFLKAFEKRLSIYRISIPQLVALASWLHGLNTSLGSGYENIAHILSGGYKKQYTGPYTLEIYESQTVVIDEIVSKLKREGNPNFITENESLFNEDLIRGPKKGALGFTADVFVESTNKVCAIELKSVRPNSGEGRGEKQKILHGRAALHLLFPNKEIRFFVGFPFDPTSDTPTGRDKQRFFEYLIEFKKYFSPEEILLGPELWDLLSGQSNTMEEILGIIDETVAEFVQS